MCGQEGGTKRKEGRERGEGPGASGCHHLPIGLLVVSGDLGPVSLAVRDSTQGLTGGHRPRQTMCVYKPDAMKRRRSEQGKRGDGGRGHGVSQQPHTVYRDKMLPGGTVGAQICPDIS